MGNLNFEFFDEFKALDNLCRDIYGETIDNRLGVTLYLEDMDRNSYQGTFKNSGWTYDYKRLKAARNLRNEIAHSRNSIGVDICTREDIDFVSCFRTRILNQTDPIAMLRKQSAKSHFSAPPQPDRQPQAAYTYTKPSKRPVGCLGIAALLLFVATCVIAFLFAYTA